MISIVRNICLTGLTDHWHHSVLYNLILINWEPGIYLVSGLYMR